jgi:hypothetical protein
LILFVKQLDAGAICFIVFVVVFVLYLASMKLTTRNNASIFDPIEQINEKRKFIQLI